MNSQVLSAIERTDAIPSPPQIVTRLLEITRDENFKQDDVVKLLSTDPGVSSDILRLANSAMFGVVRKIATLGQALTLLGIRRVRTLVIGRCMVDKLSGGSNQIIDPSYYWRRSLATGVLSAHFADHVAPGQRDIAFMGGLLCDVGVVILSRALPEKYKAVAAEYAPQQGSHFLEKELQTLGITHAEVSAAALQKWNLPEDMVQAIRHSHDTTRPNLGERAAQLAGVLNGAGQIAQLLCEAPDKKSIGSRCQDAMSLVGLDSVVLKHVLKKIEQDIGEFATILKVDVIPSRVYSLIADSIAEQLEAVPSA